jgi:non-ribosomal peptide synthase protein (TIGR01720 family)
VSGQAEAGRRPVLEAEFTAARARLAPGQGEMVQVVWFDHGTGRPGQLLLVIHYLVVDAVSWRILLPDLRDAWQSAASGRDIALKRAGTSFRHWSVGLLTAAQDPRWASALTAWTRMLPGPAPRIARRPRDRDLAGRTRSITLDLDAQVTDALLTRVPDVLSASVRDVLLTGLALAITEPGGERSVLIDVAGHGREDIVDGADVRSTIGWFTSIFPVRIDLGQAGPRPGTGEFAAAMVRHVRDQLRDLPAGGAAYGLLRYLNPVTGPVLAALPAPEVCFSYLGRLSVPDADGGEPWLPRADTGALASPGPDLPVAHLLEVVAAALAGPGGARLSIALTWPEDAMDVSGVERVGLRWAALLQMLAEHVGTTGGAGLTPSDLPLLTLSQAEIDEFQSMYQAGSAP